MIHEAISLEERLACARRELGLRHKVYPGLVQQGCMSESTAQAEIAAMQALVRTCKVLQEVTPEITRMVLELRAGRFVGKAPLLALLSRLEALLGAQEASGPVDQ